MSFRKVFQRRNWQPA